ncbi:beta-glucosidase BglX [Fulvivirga sedimenti]|uniref:Periplasmic beta-glucosidase n=1 Tax=Fulvivirga sedimenti TaxID=2879465 RepID=A0A9X1HT61_9BACT|nr:beta-glucosidase BglX [Fulvivirga sedimenti]MCA6075513.1 beta-glucosidase BglX [Fulvivirga sedimenti]MCA6076690.1 beta-glucosidase BglX [Fulvivirga sedimenti]MCA6077818.1 beta-glucosidase BglX [Fulvivirga sedimenti]
MIPVKRTLLTGSLVFTLLIGIVGCTGDSAQSDTEKSARTQKIDSLITVMTLEEKAGQLNLYVGDMFNTGPTRRTVESERFDSLVRNGSITGLFNIHGAAYTARLQRIAVEESRLGIPLVFGADVIHGFQTVFPIPLASAASWDMEAIETAERISAIESTAVGINFNFAPMVDITRDARWGRVAEGAGEDPYLGAQVTKARVRGLQGTSLDDARTMAACIKHFAAYGAPDGGKEYNTVDMSERKMREIYLPPYKAGIEAGAATIMTAFNDVNGIPATGNKKLLRQILRSEWGFDGMIVSDWNSIGELVDHGYAVNPEQATVQAIEAGVDMDMMSDYYKLFIPALVREGRLDGKLVDQAVRRVLELKWDLGLFEDPYKYSQIEREKNEIRTPEHLAAARDAGRKSIVLLKNENNLLPLPKTGKKIAVIGPLADSHADMNGTWSFFGEQEHSVTFLDGIKEVAGENNVIYAEGCGMYDDSKAGYSSAMSAARRSDVVVMVLGESAVMNGEAASRTNIKIPDNQLALLEEVTKTGKPIVVMVMTGRPLDLSWLDENIPSILCVWTLGSESGHAAADVLFGDYNPSGKLPITFPRNVGQVPIYYNHPHTGRPYLGDYSEPPTERIYLSKYRDVENSPLYPFGYGLSYTQFEYSGISVSDDTVRSGNHITVSVMLTNKGDRDGTEIAQLYIRDLKASIVRPIKELKGFKKVTLAPGESKEVTFDITPQMLAFFHANLEKKAEKGEFRVFIGGNSDVEEFATFFFD